MPRTQCSIVIVLRLIHELENIRRQSTIATKQFATIQIMAKVRVASHFAITETNSRPPLLAFGRLGLAYSKMSRHQEAIDAYKNAIRIEPDNQDYKNNMEVTQQRLEEQQQAGSVPGLGAAGLGGLGGLGGAGGIDFAAALNNPALVNMATRMMSDPSIQNMLGQLSGMNNVDALLETGRQLAMQMSSENPELFASIRQQMMDQNEGGGEGADPSAEPNIKPEPKE